MIPPNADANIMNVMQVDDIEIVAPDHQLNDLLGQQLVVARESLEAANIRINDLQTQLQNLIDATEETEEIMQRDTLRINELTGQIEEQMLIRDMQFDLLNDFTHNLQSVLVSLAGNNDMRLINHDQQVNFNELIHHAIYLNGEYTKLVEAKNHTIRQHEALHINSTSYNNQLLGQIDELQNNLGQREELIRKMNNELANSKDKTENMTNINSQNIQKAQDYFSFVSVSHQESLQEQRRTIAMAFVKNMVQSIQGFDHHFQEILKGPLYPGINEDHFVLLFKVLEDIFLKEDVYKDDQEFNDFMNAISFPGEIRNPGNSKSEFYAYYRFQMQFNIFSLDNFRKYVLFVEPFIASSDILESMVKFCHFVTFSYLYVLVNKFLDFNKNISNIHNTSVAIFAHNENAIDEYISHFGVPREISKDELFDQHEVVFHVIHIGHISQDQTVNAMAQIIRELLMKVCSLLLNYEGIQVPWADITDFKLETIDKVRAQLITIEQKRISNIYEKILALYAGTQFSKFGTDVMRYVSQSNVRAIVHLFDALTVAIQMADEYVSLKSQFLLNTKQIKLSIKSKELTDLNLRIKSLQQEIQYNEKEINDVESEYLKTQDVNKNLLHSVARLKAMNRRKDRKNKALQDEVDLLNLVKNLSKHTGADQRKKKVNENALQICKEARSNIIGTHKRRLVSINHLNHKKYQEQIGAFQRFVFFSVKIINNYLDGSEPYMQIIKQLHQTVSEKSITVGRIFDALDRFNKNNGEVFEYITTTDFLAKLHRRALIDHSSMFEAFERIRKSPEDDIKIIEMALVYYDFAASIYKELKLKRFDPFFSILHFKPVLQIKYALQGFDFESYKSLDFGDLIENYYVFTICDVFPLIILSGDILSDDVVGFDQEEEGVTDNLEMLCVHKKLDVILCKLVEMLADSIVRSNHVSAIDRYIILFFEECIFKKSNIVQVYLPRQSEINDLNDIIVLNKYLHYYMVVIYYQIAISLYNKVKVVQVSNVLNESSKHLLEYPRMVDYTDKEMVRDYLNYAIAAMSQITTKTGISTPKFYTFNVESINFRTM